MAEVEKPIVDEEEFEAASEEVSDKAPRRELTEEEKAKMSRRLTPAQKMEMRELIETGHGTVSSCAKMFGISRTSVSEWAKRNGVRANSRLGEVAKAVSAATTGKIEEKLETFESKLQERVAKFKEDEYLAASLIYRLNLKQTNDALKSANPDESLANLLPTKKSMKLTVDIHKRASDMLKAILRIDGIDAGEPQDAYEIRELTGKEVAAIRNKQKTEEDDDEIDEFPLGDDESGVVTT